MVETSPILKQATGNKSGEILRSKSSGRVSLESLEEVRRALGISPDIYRDKNDQNRNLKPELSVDEMKGGIYLANRFK